MRVLFGSSASVGPCAGDSDKWCDLRFCGEHPPSADVASDDVIAVEIPDDHEVDVSALQVRVQGENEEMIRHPSAVAGEEHDDDAGSVASSASGVFEVGDDGGLVRLRDVCVDYTDLDTEGGEGDEEESDGDEIPQLESGQKDSLLKACCCCHK